MTEKQKEPLQYFSKTRIMDSLQCPRKLWLKLHHPELESDAEAGEQRRLIGQQLGELARHLYDPKGIGVLVREATPKQAQARTQALLAGDQPIFEACFSAQSGLVYADILLPVEANGTKAWRMVEVKSSTSVKDEHKTDLAFQAQIALMAGLPLGGVALAVVDSSWTYPGGGDYKGLLKEIDLSDELLDKGAEVTDWLAEARDVAALQDLPVVTTGKQCSTPYPCGFSTHCQGLEHHARYPASMLPNVKRNSLKEWLAQGPGIELETVPDDLLNEVQLRVKTHTLSGEVYFNAEAAHAALAGRKYPLYFLDFETINMTIPIWEGTRPYQQIPFQYSVHRLDEDGAVTHAEFLDLTGGDPSYLLAETMLRDCDEEGTIYVYSAGFEKGRIRELAERYPDLNTGLLALNERMVDLLPVAKECYYHPAQAGSWSIKAVLPTVAPDLRYDELEGVQDGGMAMEAYLRAISSDTDEAELLAKQLKEYCKLDTYAMVRLWSHFSEEPLLTA